MVSSEVFSVEKTVKLLKIIEIILIYDLGVSLYYIDTFIGKSIRHSIVWFKTIHFRYVRVVQSGGLKLFLGHFKTVS